MDVRTSKHFFLIPSALVQSTETLRFISLIMQRLQECFASSDQHWKLPFSYGCMETVDIWAEMWHFTDSGRWRRKLQLLVWIFDPRLNCLLKLLELGPTTGTKYRVKENPLEWTYISSARQARVGVEETVGAGLSEFRLETCVRIFAPDSWSGWKRSGAVMWMKGRSARGWFIWSSHECLWDHSPFTHRVFTLWDPDTFSLLQSQMWNRKLDVTSGSVRILLSLLPGLGCTSSCKTRVSSPKYKLWFKKEKKEKGL